MSSSVLSYEADGLVMESHLYLPSDLSALRPGILVFPEAFGLEDHAKKQAERLASLGYVALACDLHGEGKVLTNFAEVMGIIGSLLADPMKTRVRSRGGFDALRARPEVDAARIAAIGYCFGGAMALELARDAADIRGVVGFHSGLHTARPQDAANIKAKILVCLGADDPLITDEHRAAFAMEMRNGKVDWQMHLYGAAVHSFTNPSADATSNPAVAYNSIADARSWQAMTDFLAEVL